MQRKCTRDNKFLSTVNVQPGEYTYNDQLPLDEVKEYLIVGHSDDDTLIGRIRDSVCKTIEEQSKRVILPCKVQFMMEVNNTTVAIPRLPITGKDVIMKKVGREEFEEVDADLYEWLGDELIFEVTGVMNITYEAGYDIGSLNDNLRLAILAEIAYRYENRGDKNLPAELCGTADQYIRNLIVSSYL